MTWMLSEMEFCVLELVLAYAITILVILALIGKSNRR